MRERLSWTLSFLLGITVPILFTEDDLLTVRKVVLYVVCAMILIAYFVLLRMSGDSREWKSNDEAGEAPVEYRHPDWIALGIPNLLTATRPAFGMTVFLFLTLRHDVALAATFYIIGTTTDVLDGMFARALTGTTAWGKTFDATTDAILNCLAAGGLAIYGLLTGRMWIPFAVALLTGAWLLRYRLVPGRTVVAKVASGVVRVAILALLIGSAPSESRWQLLALGAFVYAVSGVYEYAIIREEVGKGERPLY